MIKYNFCGFIWGPILQYSNDILTKINKEHNVLHFYKYKFNTVNDYETSILDIYKTDDIDPLKVKNVKIKNMLKYPKEYIYFKFYIKNPNFRKKHSTNNNISKTVENIKRNIRGIYKKKIKNYIHDIIIHVSDNFEQTNDIDKIMKKYNKYMVSEFINLKHFIKKNYINGVFDRCDTLIRKYSIQEYLNNNEYKFNIYKEMQIKRTKKNPDIYVSKFKNLIESIKKNGFNNSYPIEYSENYRLRDGSHRLGYLLILKPIFIKIKFKKWDNHGTYSLQWFKKNNFNQNCIDIINKELENLYHFL